MVLRRSWDISSGSGFRCLAPVLNRTSGCGMFAPFKCVIFFKTKYGFYQAVYGRIQPWSLCHLPAWTPLSPDIFQTWRAKATSIIFKGWMSLSLVFLHSVFGEKLQNRRWRICPACRNRPLPIKGPSWRFSQIWPSGQGSGMWFGQLMRMQGFMLNPN